MSERSVEPTMKYHEGPVGAFLQAELEQALRKPQMLVWLDGEETYEGFVEHLERKRERGEFMAPVVRYRGSYLEMMRALGRYVNGVEPEPLLIYLPGHSREMVRKTPLLELYRAGTEYRRALGTLVRDAAQGHATPEMVDVFLGEKGARLEAAEQWLDRLRRTGLTGLAAQLASQDARWVAEALFRGDGELWQTLAADARDAETLSIVRDYLHRQTGMGPEFVAFMNGEPSDERLEGVVEAFAGYLMCVEYVHDLEGAPHLAVLQPLGELGRALTRTCLDLVALLRERHPERYKALSGIAELRLEAELNTVEPERLGRIDTFDGEETRILQAAMEALRARDWVRALGWAEERQREPSFWAQRDANRRFEWTLTVEIARLGAALMGAGRPLERVTSIEEAVERYRDRAHRVDGYHRSLEQQRLKLLGAGLKHFSELLAAANDVRGLYRRWADQLAEDFMRCCQEDRFLPGASLQQRHIFRDVVEPLFDAAQPRVAVFLLGGLRYEMGSELKARIEEHGAQATLQARLAELPTITPVGMNALAPVTRGDKLELYCTSPHKIGGFRAGEFTVARPDDRVRAMKQRTVDAPGRSGLRGGSYELAEVCARPLSALRRGHGSSNLLIVHSREIDQAGEAGAGLASFEVWLTQITTAWKRLVNLGFTDFVFLSDHGFLLRDETMQEVPHPFFAKRKVSRRYVLWDRAESGGGLVPVALSRLGYEGSDSFLLLPPDTRLVGQAKSQRRYVHGGNSLQERVVPVLVVKQKGDKAPERGQYLIEAHGVSSERGACEVSLVVTAKKGPQGMLGFVGVRRFELGLRVVGRDDVQVVLLDSANGVIDNQALRVDQNQSARLTFSLSAASDDRVRVELYPLVETEDTIEPCQIEGYFPVSGLTPIARKAAPEGEGEAAAPAKPVVVAPAKASDDWSSSFDDTALVKVLRHIEQHGVIKESELTRLLGSGRKARKFKAQLAEHMQRVPFQVRVEAGGKETRYVKGY